MISSASERKIVDNYVRMVVSYISETNEYLDDEDYIGYPSLTYWSIVQSLLLNGTTHAGMTSSIEKCRELGLDPYEYPFDKFDCTP